MKPPPADEPILLNLIRSQDVVAMLNGEALDPAAYRDLIERREGVTMTIGRLMQAASWRELLGIEHPWHLVRGARLRHLVDEWMATGHSADGDFPARRHLARTSEAVAAVRKSAATNPCSLFYVEKTGDVGYGRRRAPRGRRCGGFA